MNIYLAATSNVKNAFLDGNIDASKVNVLESFYSIQPWQIEFLPKFKNFLLDSGAFTFLNQKKSQKIEFNKYADEYAEFIVKYNITKYFELDIDSIVDLDEVEKIRERIERQTKIKSIPVWHKNRGKQYFIDMCKNYPYVSLGGIALKEIQISIFEKMFPWFINTAHYYNCKIHGLGFTQINKLPLYHFDSVDSTTWINGQRFGELHQFIDNKIIIHRSVKNGIKYRVLKEPYRINVHNFNEWVKFSQYADKKL